MTEYSFRRARAEDAPAIANVHVASWKTTYPGIVKQAYIDALSVEDRTRAWDTRLRNDVSPGPDVIVAEAPPLGIVGFASGGPIRHAEPGFDGELYAIYLRREAQQRGVGRRLVGEWAGLAVARGLRAAVVGVLAANPARHFYERLGARRLRESEFTIGGDQYPELWYGWDDLHALMRASGLPG